MKIRIIVFGASGMVGEGVLLHALNHEAVESVLVVGRRTCGVVHPRLREILRPDLFDLSGIEDQLRGYDGCYFCLGVSSVGMKEPEYRRITYDLTLSVAALLSRLNPAMTFCYISGAGTDSTEQGRLMWARVKGKTENDLAKLPFKGAYAFRPGMIKPISGQRNVKRLFRVVTWPFPIWKALFPGAVSTVADIGEAMIRVTLEGSPKRALENLDIAELAGTPPGSLQGTIVTAGLTAGFLDGIAALVYTYLLRGSDPFIVFQFIASGLLGPQAFSGGFGTVLIGILFHLGIATSWAALYAYAYPRIRLLRRNRVASGIGYGLVVWLVMNLIVIPMSLIPSRQILLSNALIGIAILIVMVGLPIAFIIHRHFTPLKGDN